MNQKLFDKSLSIVQIAIDTYKPKMIVSLVSGGVDSLTSFYVAKHLNISIDRIIHVYTGTGIKETRQFVEDWSKTTSVPLLISDAGTSYEDYVNRKGFFGKGRTAHTYAYHVLKANPLRKAISSLRQRRRNFPVLMLTGIRLDESSNRKYNFENQTYKRDPASKNNIFVNLIEHWSEQDCREFLSEVNAPKNPVSKALHRSAECMCGTMQSNEDRQLASILYPEWGKWLDNLEFKIKIKHGWGWGENMPKSCKPKDGDGFEMCRHCLLNQSDNNFDASK